MQLFLMSSKQKIYLYIAWAVAVMALLGSLFFSEILKFPPCTLCWWQRIAIYPLVVIFTVAVLVADKRVYLYALPLSLFGFIVAGYHSLLQAHIITETTPCISTVPCDVPQILWLGFITIPLLSFAALLVINICMFLFARENYKLKKVSEI